MIKNKNGKIQHCPNCYSTDLHILKDEELLPNVGGSEFTEIISCGACSRYFTIEFMSAVIKNEA